MNNSDNNSFKSPLTEKEKQELKKKLLTDLKEENRKRIEELNQRIPNEGGCIPGPIMGIISIAAVAFWMFVFRGCSF